MAKFVRTTLLGLAAVMLGGSLALAQAPAPPDTGKTPPTTQTPKKGKRARKKAPARKKRAKKPATGTQPPDSQR